MNRERLAKTIYRPWSAARLFQAEQSELVDREWELQNLIHKINTELLLVRSRFRGNQK